MDKNKILVVDDEIEFLEIVKTRLEANGHTVVTATSGEEALQKVKVERPDAILMDVTMPGINGLDVLKKIRQEDKRLPIFIMTAFSSEEKSSLANVLDASGFILKTDDLQKEVENIGAAIRIAEKYKK
ncbi:MAG: response regulator [Chlamydiae bacterium]|nr:response regulator [Chlamydiota bacterium]MBI3278039.1 response regulator [Chlamydiota bacterium]